MLGCEWKWLSRCYVLYPAIPAAPTALPEAEAEQRDGSSDHLATTQRTTGLLEKPIWL